MFTSTLIAGAFATLIAAQSTVLTFTHVPNPITDGQAQAITYATNDTTTPVIILLRKGISTELTNISVITTSATGGQFIWTPPLSLADANDYALEVIQGSQKNYFGPFVIQGADPAAVSSASVASMAKPSAYPGTTHTPLANGTASVTGVMGGGSGMATGTGTAVGRNTTMSMASLTGTSSVTGTRSGSGSLTSTATGSARSSSASSGAAVLRAGGVVGLVLGAAAAAVFCL
ncbi:hypothetical protein LTR62_005143 [Meristemomyces frigidus]|uniref:Yeast cell wall synthesis Kre9/Knh1-like N-terminal domain-containing protein n=1 Tax=Meristemomyces frigidus TaxID=1508187 RepID=A0AAN7TWW8_9PEZI|nr:hypothetical protein LTR62_005143 [Meristemomyces frigidus]